MRVARVRSGEATYLFMGGLFEVSVELPSGSVTSSKSYYSVEGQMLAMSDATTTQYLLTDHLGSVVGVVDDSGALVSEQRYLPFGEARTDLTGITATDLSFTGQRSLTGTGLLDYHARQYDPSLKVFIQADSIIPNPYGVLDYNRYLYVHANPLRFTDPSGNRYCEDIDCTGRVSNPEKDQGCGKLGQVMCNGTSITDWLKNHSPSGTKKSIVISAGWGSNFYANGNKIPTILYWAITYVRDAQGGIQLYYETLDIEFNPTLNLEPGEKENPSELFGIGISVNSSGIWKTDNTTFFTTDYKGESHSIGGSFGAYSGEYFESYPKPKVKGGGPGLSMGSPSIWSISTYAHPITERIDIFFWD